VKVGGSLGCTKHETVEFRILSEESKTSSSIKTLDLRRADLSLVRDLLGRMQQVNSLEGKWDQESWLIFMNKFLRAQRQSFLMCRKQAQ